MSNQILTGAELEEFVRLNKTRTQGEWRVGTGNVWTIGHRARVVAWTDSNDTRHQNGPYKPLTGEDQANAAFIAACSVMVPGMLETIRAYREAAKAFQDLNVCYRLGKTPGEKLFARLEAARKTMKVTDA